jgi:hypothetical protein
MPTSKPVLEKLEKQLAIVLDHVAKTAAPLRQQDKLSD